MTLFNTIALLITISALFSYLNHRYVKLPTTIGLMLIALLASLSLTAFGELGWMTIGDETARLLAGIDFGETLLHGMLGFLLFAGALHLNLNDLARQKWVITLLASFGVVGATFLVGLMSRPIFAWLGFDLPLIVCFLFGALIAPTDPIAVLGILKTAGVPESLATKIAGESLFNDGVAVVVFLALLDILSDGHSTDAAGVAQLFAKEALGGALFGLGAGFLAYRMLKSVDNYQVEILITLALVTGGYALADSLHLSAPIAMVVAGLLIGNHGRLFAMSERTRRNLDTFWELVDEILNAVLFVLIGLEVLVLPIAPNSLIAGLLVIPVVLLSRLISVAVPIFLLRRIRTFSPGVIRILTWAGLRGGISVALALALPAGPHRNLLLVVTYVVVVFSIVVQGLTIGKVARSVG